MALGNFLPLIERKVVQMRDHLVIANLFASGLPDPRQKVGIGRCYVEAEQWAARNEQR